MSGPEAPVLVRLARAIAREGPLGLIGLIRKNIVHHYRLWLDRRFDRRFKTDTSGRIELDRLSVVGGNREHGVYYESTPTALFKFFLANTRLDFERFTFIDLGSGKGRTLMLASDYPFGRVVGVEFSPELHEVAVRNLDVYTSPAQRCKALESVNADATTYDFPRTPLFLYAYNPFDDTVMTAVLENLMRSLQAAPREVILVYYNPRWWVLDKFPMLALRARLNVPYDPTRDVQRRAAIFANFELPRGRGWL